MGRWLDYSPDVANVGCVFWQETATPLGISATQTGASRGVGAAVGEYHPLSSFNAFAFADQAGTLRVEVSSDNVTWRRATADVAVAANTAAYLSVPVAAAFHRAVFVNGGVAQAQFQLNTSYTAA